MHWGIDYSGAKGTPILATADGTVDRVAYSVGYGRMVVIDHGNDVKTVYAHLKKFNVKEGQRVFKGDQIAELGSSGMSTGPHLHYEVVVKGANVDPLKLIVSKESSEIDIINNYQKLEKYARNERVYKDRSSEEFNEWGAKCFPNTRQGTRRLRIPTEGI